MPRAHVHTLFPCFAALLIALGWSASALADQPSAPLVTDRPDVAESSLTVGKGTFQMEVGADATVASQAARQVVFPLKLRQGVTPNLELHIETDTFAISSDASGLTSPEVGMKWHLGESAKGTFSLGFLSALSLPLNASQGFVFYPTIACDVSLTPKLGFGLNAGASIYISPRLTDLDAARFASSFGQSWNQHLSTYLELFGEWQFSGALAVSADTGVIYRLTDDLQLDAYVRQGLLRAEDTGVGLGVSLRL